MPPRSPVIFWLLLAATLSVDVVVCSWVATAPFRPPQYARVAFEALVIGQLSLVCIWSAFRTTKLLWVPAIAAAVAATLFTAMFASEPTSFASTFKSNVAHAVSMPHYFCVALWLLQRTEVLAAAHRCFARIAILLVMHLLIAMTVVAVLASYVRKSPMFGEFKFMYLAFTCGNVATCRGQCYPLEFIGALAAATRRRAGLCGMPHHHRPLDHRSHDDGAIGSGQSHDGSILLPPKHVPFDVAWLGSVAAHGNGARRR